MKLRYIFLAYTLLMAGILLFMGYGLFDGSENRRDMVFYNQQQKQVEAALTENRSRKEICDRYGCELLFFTDDDYQQQFRRLVQGRAVVLDLFVEGEIAGKVAWEEEAESYRQQQDRLLKRSLLLWGLFFAAGALLLFSIYRYVVCPFQRLQKFSLQIAKGNFDFPLPVQRHDFFGAYAESIDLMREELKRARESEYQANRSKKELVAELSHDIKTPIATIKAACELLTLKEQNKETLKKLAVIEAKADTVERLAANMFQASLEELAELKVEAVEKDSRVIEKLIQDLNYYDQIEQEGSVPECLIWLDSLRLEQALDNIVSNSYKYAQTKMKVSFREIQGGMVIQLRDQGPGVLETELSCITEKFYRGSNAKGKSGSGLGLYLAKIFLEKMGGGLDCYNCDGFVVELFLRKV